MKKVIIYSRYSSDMQNERSIVDQERTCEEYAARQGWTVVQKYSDHGISGASIFNRPGILKAMEVIKASDCDVLLAEHTDRVSRGQYDSAMLFEELTLMNVEMHTVSEGKIDRLRSGIMGAMNSVQLDIIRDKVRRGLTGVVLDGRNAGGKCYGYDVVQNNGEAGEAERGELVINEFEASIVNRIFQDYAKGKSPRKIAFELNAEGIPGPTGKAWGASTIYGNRQRGTGILNNELYVGVRVWNRLSYRKNYRTGQRVSSINPESEWIKVEVPELRIIEQDLWDQVRGYQGVLNKRKSDLLP